MTKHADLLGLLFIIWGALTVLVGAAMLILGIGAAAMITSGGSGEPGSEIAAGITAVTFIILAGGALLWGLAHLWNGFGLRRHRHSARVMGLVLAVLNLFFLPFGTALGVYGLWVLLNDQTRSLFEPAQA
jgi:hypothetical protein